MDEHPAKVASREWRNKNPKRYKELQDAWNLQHGQAAQLRSKFKMTVEEYEALFDRQGVVAPFVGLQTLPSGVLITITNVVRLVEQVVERHVANVYEGSFVILVMSASQSWVRSHPDSNQRLSISTEVCPSEY